MDSILGNHFEQLISILSEKFCTNVKVRQKKLRKDLSLDHLSIFLVQQ